MILYSNVKKGNVDMSVDIIIPIYNAFDELKICLQSVIDYTDLTKNRIILINDKSSDQRIIPYLSNQIKDNILVINNEINRGFSNNINLGIAQSSTNDVLLLNSDTIVTEYWLEKITRCAYSSKTIGTVTPLSNNATLCSVPNFCEENQLPEGMTLERAAYIIDRCSLKKYPQITVANGFCMFIKREVINLIGYFDAETFGRGYGEENDFCYRAEQIGYIHVMCDDVYIYHSGTKSFLTKEKQDYIRIHDKILRTRYPIQMKNNDLFCQINPNASIGKNIGLYFDLLSGKKNILYLLQSDFREGTGDNIGGTQLHVKHLTFELRKDCNVFVATRDNEYLYITAYVDYREYLFRFIIGKKSFFPALFSRELSSVFHCILKGFQISLVHVHHTMSTSLDIFLEAEKLDIPVFFSIHDYYYICPNEKLLNMNGKICKTQSSELCAECLAHQKEVYIDCNYIEMWRRQHETVLKTCKHIIAPTESAKKIFSDYYPELQKKISVIEHGVVQPGIISIINEHIQFTDNFEWLIEKINKANPCIIISGIAYLKGEENKRYKIILKIIDQEGKSIYLPTNFSKNISVLQSKNTFIAFVPNNILVSGDLRISAILVKEGIHYAKRGQEEVIKDVIFQRSDKFRVAFIGGINKEKGGNEIANIIKHGPSDVEWFILGGIGEESLLYLEKENLIKMDYYYQEDLGTHLKFHEIDAICILSKWPETFSYTLSEAILSNIPVITTDVGALGERVKKYKYGEVVPLDDKLLQRVLKIINSWKIRGENYNQCKNNIEHIVHKSIKEMVRDYINLYKLETITDGEQYGLTLEDKKCLSNAFLYGNKLSEDKEVLLSKINDLENRISTIDSSVVINLALKVANIRIPFKKQIRDYLLKHRI